MSSNKERQPSQNSGSEEQTDNESQKKAAPEYPPATEASKRTHIINDGADSSIRKED
ncbi:MAG: hypothetical protein HC874_29020 [Richelia sp. SL_2_1]|nr:hypothetical protein [Richelia sp. SM1_7_0]NJO31142.1 hypothetical protein [Richelia sp. SL_2_1]